MSSTHLHAAARQPELVCPSGVNGKRPEPDAHRRPRELSANKPDDMPALVGIRFPLAIWVVVHHLSGSGNILHGTVASLPLVQAVVDFAWIALPVFFAISGFVLTLRYRSQVWSGGALARYAVARFARVYPVYAFSLLLVAPIVAEAVSSGRTGGAGQTTAVLLNYALLLQGWARPPFDWNTPAWSLSCEMFYYACFPAAIVMLGRVKWRRAWGMLFLAVALGIGVRLAGVPTTIKPFLYAGDFLAGMSAAAMYLMLTRRGHRVPGYWLYAPALAVSMVLVFARADMPFVVLESVLRVAVAALVLGLAFGCRALASTSLMWGGRASYAMYILHIPMLWWYKRWAMHMVVPPVEAAVLYIAIVIAVSLLVCRFLEQPAERLIRSAFGRRSPVRPLPLPQAIRT